MIRHVSLPFMRWKPTFFRTKTENTHQDGELLKHLHVYQEIETREVKRVNSFPEMGLVTCPKSL